HPLGRRERRRRLRRRAVQRREADDLRRPGPRCRHLYLPLLDPPATHERGDDRQVTPAGEQLCYTDAYARHIEARVASVAGGDVPLVVLDRTTFYPGGGGQPSDRGVLLRAADGRTWTVRAARKIDGEIAHELEPSPDGPPAVGDRLEVDLEWARRLALMRTHTALHALCGVVWRD